MNSEVVNDINPGKMDTWEDLSQFLDYPDFLTYLDKQGSLEEFNTDKQNGENFLFWRNCFGAWYQDVQDNKWLYFDHQKAEKLIPFQEALRDYNPVLLSIFIFEYKDRELTCAPFWVDVFKHWQQSGKLPQTVDSKIDIYETGNRPDPERFSADCASTENTNDPKKPAASDSPTISQYVHQGIKRCSHREWVTVSMAVVIVCMMLGLIVLGIENSQQSDLMEATASVLEEQSQKMNSWWLSGKEKADIKDTNNMLVKCLRSE